jgi:hypothetical protein
VRIQRDILERSYTLSWGSVSLSGGHFTTQGRGERHGRDRGVLANLGKVYSTI